jgi:hypothetical protein
MRIILVSLALICGCLSALAAFHGVVSSPSGNLPFVLPTGSVLHYMASNGNDSCNGRFASIGSSGNCAWATPNHPMNCGEVIIAAAGTYNGDLGHFGAVSNCPSTTGGIDGLGGIQAAVLLCGGADVTSCKVDCATAQCYGDPSFGPAAAININNSNWSVQGWNLTCNTVLWCEAMQADGKAGCRAVSAHISFINNLTYNNGQAFNTQACLSPNGPDYVAVVGNIAQNSTQINFVNNGICIAAIDVIAPGVSDADTTHTHFFIYNNYSFNNLVPGCDRAFDGEDYMFDALDQNSVIGHAVGANNIGYYAERMCWTFTFNGHHVSNPLVKIYQNTCTENNQRDSANAGGNNAEMLMTPTGGPTIPWSFQIFNNIIQQSYSTNPQTGSEVLYALFTQPATSLLIGAQVRPGAENILNGSPSSTRDATNGGSGATTGRNTSANPGFKNVSDLITNHLGVPNCTGFGTTTACMGWNANTNTMTSLSVLDDLTPTAGGMAGKGFQLPSTTCLSSGDIVTDYPAWLKGIVYLHWNGASLTENADLATKPCGM